MRASRPKQKQKRQHAPGRVVRDAAGGPTASSTNTTANEEESRKEYLEFRKYLMEREHQGYENFDKTVLTLTSTALAFSLTLGTFLGASRTRIELLAVAWGAFAFGIACSLVSLILSPAAYRRQIEILDLDYSGDPEALQRQNSFDWFIDRLNYITTGACLCGIACFAAYVYFNV